MVFALWAMVFAGKLAADCRRSYNSGCGRASGEFLAVYGAGDISKGRALYRPDGDDCAVALTR